MKYLVVYYSRTGNTKKVGLKIAETLNCDEKEIFDKKDRSGALGFLRGGWDAWRENKTEIYNNHDGLTNHDHLIIGTPVWAGKPTPAIRTYIEKRKRYFEDESFFCTHGGSGGEGAFDEMENLTGKKPVRTLELSEDDLKNDDLDVKVKEFVKSIKESNKEK
ncbi:MAG: flavodoxin family protein [Candidatus Thermoplasmatota archaeon]|nr:flavodoxin family protein [Candidatus Thermoplasmatota archaeon]